MQTLSAETLRSLIRYEPETGKLFWLSRTPDMFLANGERSPEGSCSQWNKRYAGKEALVAVDSHGYLYGNIFQRKHKAHRVAFCIAHGRWPANTDHIDGDRQNNRLANLRDVTIGENNLNLARRNSNKSGVSGVTWDDGRGRWMVRCRRRHVGRYDSFDAAVAARREAERAHGFHENHGR